MRKPYGILALGTKPERHRLIIGMDACFEIAFCFPLKLHGFFSSCEFFQANFLANCEFFRANIALAIALVALIPKRE